MPEFITKNIGTIIVALIVVLIVVFTVFRMVRNKKKGKSSCSCGCSECPFSGKCGEKNDVGEKK